MKEVKTLITIIGIALLCGTSLSSCGNSSNSKEGSGQSDNIAPTDADETRYNLSEQQKMSMQKDTTLVDSTGKDSSTDVRQ